MLMRKSPSEEDHDAYEAVSNTQHPYCAYQRLGRLCGNSMNVHITLKAFKLK